MCVDNNNTLVICDTENKRICSMHLTPPFFVETVCGNGRASHENLNDIRFSVPISVCVDEYNAIFVLDYKDNMVYKINNVRERAYVCYNNSMLSKSFYGDQSFINYCVWDNPTNMKIQRNKSLIILNCGKISLCKISLLLCIHKKLLWISTVKYETRDIDNFDVAINGDIVLCMFNISSNFLSFYSIKPNGTKMYIAQKGGNNLIYVADLKIIPRKDMYPASFNTIEMPIADGGLNHVATTHTFFKLKWDLVRILFIGCFKPVSTATDGIAKTFELVPHGHNGIKYSPILMMILQFVNDVF